jgi:hypothetical protein
MRQKWCFSAACLAAGGMSVRWFQPSRAAEKWIQSWRHYSRMQYEPDGCCNLRIPILGSTEREILPTYV